MPKDKMSLAFCLHEIAHNITQYGEFGIRIGLSRIDFVCDGYEVTDWNGKHTHHADLVDAIGKFIEVQPK